MTVDRVELSLRSRADLDELLSYLLERNPAAAERLSADLDVAFKTLATQSPRVDGSKVTLRSGKVCMRWLVHPVLVFYERAPERVFVLAIHHHAREPITR